MTGTIQKAKAIASKPDEDITIADVANLLSAMITGLPKLIAALGVIIVTVTAVFKWFGGEPGSSPGTAIRALRAETVRADSIQERKIERIEDLLVIGLGQNQQQSYQLCLLQPGARPTQCATILLDNRLLDSLLRRPRR